MGNSRSTVEHGPVDWGEKDNEQNWPYVWAIRDAEVLDWRTAGGGMATTKVTQSAPDVPTHAPTEATASAGASILQSMSAEDIQAISARQNQLPVEISQYLFLGDAKSARDVPRLKERGITHVLNVAGPSAAGPVADYQSAGIEYHQIDADDEEGYAMLAKHLEEALAFVALAQAAEGGKCVVHCHAGINRSGVLVAAIHMLHTKSNVLDVVAHCRMQRGNAFLWNHTFQAELVALARERGLLGPKPGDEGCRVLAVAPLPPAPLGPPPKPRPSAALARLM